VDVTCQEYKWSLKRLECLDIIILPLCATNSEFSKPLLQRLKISSKKLRALVKQRLLALVSVTQARVVRVVCLVSRNKRKCYQVGHIPCPLFLHKKHSLSYAFRKT